MSFRKFLLFSIFLLSTVFQDGLLYALIISLMTSFSKIMFSDEYWEFVKEYFGRKDNLKQNYQTSRHFYFKMLNNFFDFKQVLQMKLFRRDHRRCHFDLSKNITTLVGIVLQLALLLFFQGLSFAFSLAFSNKIFERKIFCIFLHLFLFYIQIIIHVIAVIIGAYFNIGSFLVHEQPSLGLFLRRQRLFYELQRFSFTKRCSLLFLFILFLLFSLNFSSFKVSLKQKLIEGQNLIPEGLNFIQWFFLLFDEDLPLTRLVLMLA